MSNFNEIVDRKGTDCFKWDLAYREFKEEDLQEAAQKAIPMWIADMDFAAPEPVREAIQKIVDHGVFGYTGRTDSYFAALKEWLYRRHGWTIEKEWVDFSPGVLPGIAACVRAFSKPGDKIIIQTPVYYPFRDIVLTTGRQLAENALIENEMHYTIDFNDLEAKASDPNTKLLILCSPHNPVGRVWREDELKRISDICKQYDVMVIADEIHSDLIIGDMKHLPIGRFFEERKDLYVAFYAPSKTFNLAGLQTGAVVIPNEKNRNAYRAVMRAEKIYSGTPFGLAAFVAAYTKCEDWLEELLLYLKDNYHYLQEFLRNEIPQVKCAPLEGTYLVWLNFKDCKIKKEDLNQFLLEKAGLMLDFGDWFDEKYLGYARMNIACPRKILMQGLKQLKEAIVHEEVCV